MDFSLYFSDKKPRMAIFVSKMSHCLFDLLSRYSAGEWNVEVPLIVSNHPDMKHVAEMFGIPYYIYPITKENRLEQETAMMQLLEEQNIDFDLKAIPCDGIEECRMALLKKSKNVLDANFIEGMACVGGCIGGAGCLTHGEKNKAEVDKYGREAHEKNISDAISLLK